MNQLPFSYFLFFVSALGRDGGYCCGGNGGGHGGDMIGQSFCKNGRGLFFTYNIPKNPHPYMQTYMQPSMKSTLKL